MADLSAFDKALVRHLISLELDNSDKTTTADGRKHNSPKSLTDVELADLLNVHVNTVRNHKRLPAVQAAVKKGLEDAESSKDYFTLCLRHRALENMWVEYEKAKGNDRRQYLRMILDETKGVDESDSQPVSYEDMTDEDLIATCLSRDVSPLGMTLAQLRAKAKGESCSTPHSPESLSAPDCSPSEPTEAGGPGTSPVKPAAKRRSPSRKSASRRRSPSSRSR